MHQPSGPKQSLTISITLPAMVNVSVMKTEELKDMLELMGDCVPTSWTAKEKRSRLTEMLKEEKAATATNVLKGVAGMKKEV